MKNISMEEKISKFMELGIRLKNETDVDFMCYLSSNTVSFTVFDGNLKTVMDYSDFHSCSSISSEEFEKAVNFLEELLKNKSELK